MIIYATISNIKRLPFIKLLCRALLHTLPEQSHLKFKTILGHKYYHFIYAVGEETEAEKGKAAQLTKKEQSLGLLWWSSGWDSMLPLQEARVRSLVGELGSRTPHSVAKKFFKKKERSRVQAEPRSAQIQSPTSKPRAHHLSGMKTHMRASQPLQNR